jgi:mycothiol synthase
MSVEPWRCPVYRRAYRGASDLAAVQQLVAQRTMVMGIGTNLHPGDIAHRIYNGLRWVDDRRGHVHIWEDAEWVAGFGLTWPNEAAFDVVTRLDLTGGATRSMISELTALVSPDGHAETDVIGGDPGVTDSLSAIGYRWSEDVFAFTAQRLPGPRLPTAADYRLRAVAAGDAAALAAVHGSAFGSRWTAEKYAELMSTPGYVPEREIVAVADDGSFAGFAVTWYDELNRVGHFEPVGVAREHHRRGVGRLLLAEGMRRMWDAGMTTATVWHSLADERASAFYRSCGFERLTTVSRWVLADEPTPEG